MSCKKLKLTYSSKELAVIAAQKIEQEILSPLFSYRCRSCQGYHLTSTPQTNEDKTRVVSRVDPRLRMWGTVLVGDGIVSIDVPRRAK